MSTRRVFLSYSSKDAQVADLVRENLETGGRPVWVAPRDVPTGVSYPEAIVSAIRDCDSGLLILSENSNESPHVLREVERLTALGKPLHVLRIDDIQLSDGLAYFASLLQWIDAPRTRLVADPATVLSPVLTGESAALAHHVATGATSVRKGPAFPLVVGGLMLALIGAVVAVVLSSSGGSGDRAEADTKEPSARNLPSTVAGSSGAGAQRTCMDGRRIPASEACGEPVGQAALDAVFPGIPSSDVDGNPCETRRSALKGRLARYDVEYRQCKEQGSGEFSDRVVPVTYVRFVDRDEADAYLLERFGSSTPQAGTPWIVRYGPKRLGDGFEEVRTYASDHPFVVLVACGDPRVCRSVVDSVDFLAPGRFDS